MKRIKYVYQNASQVAFIWAKQSQTTARCKNAAFDDKSICSYGSHYLLGRLMKFNGRPIAAVNYSRYSKTTTSHSNGAAIAAESAGHLVVVFRVAENERHVPYDASDETVKTAILHTLEEEAYSLYSRLEEIIYSKSYVDFVKCLFEDLEQFNKKVRYLCLDNLEIEVPDYYFQEAMEIAKMHELASKNKYNRRQLVFSFSGGYKVCEESGFGLARRAQKRAS